MLTAQSKVCITEPQLDFRISIIDNYLKFGTQYQLEIPTYTSLYTFTPQSLTLR